MVTTRQQAGLGLSKPSSQASPVAKVWSHTPSNLTLYWLAISVPLVLWDAGYVMLRPHSMPGGKYHWPLWVPYDLYGRTDYVYGWKAFNEHNGFTAAQTIMNYVETAGYLVYLYIVFTFGTASRAQGRGAPKEAGFLSAQRKLTGDKAALAALVGYSAAIMTVSKTLLYWLNEYFSGFENIGHNSWPDLVVLWIIPNGAWLLVPSYMAYVFGSEILQGLSIASGAARPAADDTRLAKDE